MTTVALAKRYRLSDGSTFTAKELSDKLGLTQTAARYRLDQSNDVGWVMREHFKVLGRKKAHTCKKFTLSDGSTDNSAESLARKYNINQSTMYARLSRGIRDVHILAQAPTAGRQRGSKNEYTGGYIPINKQPKAVRADILKRNAYDPMSKLFLTMGVGV